MLCHVNGEFYKILKKNDYINIGWRMLQLVTTTTYKSKIYNKKINQRKHRYPYLVILPEASCHNLVIRELIALQPVIWL